MSLSSWCASRCGGVSFIALLVLCIWVLSQETKARTTRPDHANSVSFIIQPTPDSAAVGTGIWKYIFAYYSLLVHCLIIIVTFRACWAVWELTTSLQPMPLTLWKIPKPARAWKLSSTSLSSADTSISQISMSQSSSEIDALDSATESEDDAELVIHTIIIPNYKEDVDILKETLDVLASHPQAKYTYDVYLAMEQREVRAGIKSSHLISKFKNSFRYITATFHPSDIPGESTGKSSNLSWAARAASERYGPEIRKDVIITSIDADSHLSARYFSEITGMHLAYPDSASTTLYTAPIIFDRNAHQVPGIVCVADVLWCAAGLSGLYPGSTISPPTSVYSVPLDLADRVGGWDAGPEAIGEDLHMYLKCFFALNGHLTSRTVRSPVSQTNVTGPEGVGLVGYVGGVSARYRQALRHMWGSLDSGYALKKCGALWRRKRLSWCLYRPLHAVPNEVADELLSRMGIDEFSEYQMERGHTPAVRVPLLPPHWLNIFLLFHRLFEAHFLPTHITVLIVISTLYRALIPADSGPFSIAWTFVATDILRAVGMVALLIYFYSYQKYHRIALESRKSEMVAAGLADGMRGSFSGRSWKNVLGCIYIPLVAPLYGSIPAIHAQLSHFWTMDLVYVVSNKTVGVRFKDDIVLNQVRSKEEGVNH